MTDAELNALLEQIRAQTEAINRLTNSLGKVSGDIGQSIKDNSRNSSIQNKALEKIAKAQQQSQKSLESNINKMMSGAMRAMGQTRKASMDREVNAAKKAAGGSLSAEKIQAAKIQGATKHMERLGLVSLAASAGLEALGKNAVILGKKLGAGEAGAGDFASAISNTVQSVTGFTKYLGKAGFVVSTVMETMAKFAVVAAQQGDTQYQVFKDLQKSGANTSGGLNDVNRLLGSFGLHVKDAGKMMQTIAANAQGLVMFRGTVAEGAKAMGGVVKDLRDSGLQEQLALMGISYDEQRESIAANISLQARLGKSQNMTTQQLARSAAEYMKEQDALTRLTGATRKEQEETRNRAMAEEQFRTRLERLKQQGPAGQAQAANLEKTYQILAAEYGKDIASQMGSLADGITTDFNKGLQVLTGGRAGEIMTGGGTPEEIARALGPILKDSMRTVGEQFGQVGQFRQQTGIEMGNLYDRLERGPLGERMARVQREQGAFAEGRGGVGGAVEMAEANIKTMRAMQDLVQLGVVPVMNAMGKLSKLIGNIAGGLSSLNPLNLFSGTEVPKFADGGIARGPDSGHLAMLHGTEAVIPLKGGKVPLDFGAGLARLSGGATAGGATGAADLNKNIVNMTKAMVPFTEALNSFTNTVKTTGATGYGEGAEARKGESMFDKMVSFIANLFDGAAPGGRPGGGRAATPEATAQEALAAHDHAHPHGEKGGAVSPEVAKQISAGFVNPLEKMVQTSGFGTRTMNGKVEGHGAIDFAGKIGDKIMAPVKGVARVLTEAESGGYGNMVEITDSITGFKHILAHMDKTMIKTGDVIEAGTQIGTVGSTGRSTGAHLHHEMRDKAGNKIDPSQFYKGVVDTQGRPIAPPGFGSTAGGAATGYPHLTRPGMAGELGSMSQKYESGTAGSMAVGRDRSGGTSYGKYQIASKVGSMDSFLQLLKQNDPEAHARLMSAGPQDAGAEGKFAQEWKKLAGEGRIQKSEREFAVDKIFKPAMGGLKDQDLSKMIEGNKGLQEMMFSMAIQHGPGGAPAILNKVFKKGMSAEQLTEAAYAERGAEGGQRYFGKSSEAERAGVVSRFGREKQDVLAMLGMPGGAPGMPAGPVPGVAPTMVAGAPAAPMVAGAPAAPAVAAGQTPIQSLLSSLLGPQIGGMIGGLAGPVLPGSAGTPAATPNDLVAAIKEQGTATSDAITNSIASLKDSLGVAGGAGGTLVPDLLNEMIGAQRDQTAAINRLIQVQNA